MAAGYALGPVIGLDAKARRRWLLMFGGAVTAGFVLLRVTNLYGDPDPWTMQETWSATVLSFLNCEKYPPSLLSRLNVTRLSASLKAEASRTREA